MDLTSPLSDQIWYLFLLKILVGQIKPAALIVHSNLKEITNNN